MGHCPHCGREHPASAAVCPHCEQSLAAGEKPADDGPREPTPDVAATGEESEPASETVTTGVSRRGMLAYGGGTALATWGGIGAGWFAFVYERTSPEEDVVREYVDAVDRSKFYTAQQLFHEDAPGEAWSATEIPDVDRLSLTIENTEVVDRQSEVDHENVRELALVVAEITIESSQQSETIEVGFVVAQNDGGEWKLWEDR